MSILNWIGKEKIVNHDKEVPFRLLRKNKKYSLGKSENLIVEGDNLEALKALMPFYYGKIKCIYIDPPYNTGNEKWVYNDKVNSPKIKEWLGRAVGPEGEDLCRHDKWLCMMYPRLKLLYDLLADDGVIFVSIDDNENYHLRQLMNEIFGENNFIAQFIWEKTQHFGRQKVNFYSNCEYIQVYAKNLLSGKKLKELLVKKIKSEFDDAPLYNASNNESKLIFPRGKVIFNIEDGKYLKTSDKKYKLLDKIIVKNGKNKNTLALSFKSRWSQKKINEEIKKGAKFWVKSDNFAIRGIYGSGKKFNDSSKQIIFTNKNNPFVAIDRFGQKVGTTEEGSAELENIFGVNGLFDYPKPSSLIRYLVSLYFNRKENKYPNDFIILDSFAGSGTTGHAVLDLNKEDGGKRKFILVEMEKNIAKNITAEREKRVARGYSYKTGKGKVMKVPGLGGGFEYVELGEPLFNKDGMISESVSFEDMAHYVYFTETRTNLEKKNIQKNYLGEFDDVHYFLLFDGIGKNILNRKFLKELKPHKGEKKIIYADKCLLDDEVLEKNQIIFKQIPYQIKVY